MLFAFGDDGAVFDELGAEVGGVGAGLWVGEPCDVTEARCSAIGADVE